MAKQLTFRLRTLSYLFFLLTVCPYPELSAQTLAEVFDDGQATTASNILRTDLASLYRGEATLSYERLFGQKQFGLEGGVGLRVGENRHGPLNELIGGPGYDLSDASGSNSAFVKFRMYSGSIYFPCYVFLLGMRSQGFSFDRPNTNDFRFTEVSTAGGLHLLAFDQVTVDAYGDVIYRFMGDRALAEVEKLTHDQGSKFDILFRLGLEVGFLF